MQTVRTQFELNNIKNMDYSIHTLHIISDKSPNCISYFPDNLILSPNLVSFTIKKTRISHLPLNLFAGLSKLETVDFSENDLTVFGQVLPDTLTSLNLSFNAIHEININIENLEFLDLQFNNLKQLPESFQNTRTIISLGHNDFPKINVQNNDIYRNNYIHGTNVHNSHITDYTKKMVSELLSLNLKTFDNIYKSIQKVYAPWFYQKIIFYFTPFGIQLKNLLNQNYSYQYDYTIGNEKTITYSEMIKNVWAFIQKIDDKNTRENLIANFKIQILDGIGYCNVGKFTRIMNVLLGHMTTKFEKPLNEQLADKIQEIQNSETDKTLIHDKFKNYMIDKGMAPEEIQVWLEPLF